MDEELHKQFIEAFEAIRQQLRVLVSHIQEDLTNFPAWIEEGGKFLQMNASNAIVNLKALENFQQQPHLAPQETYACLGVIAGNECTLSLIETVNRAKDGFKSIVVNQVRPVLKNPKKAEKAIRDTLAKQGEKVVNLLQVYRHIRCIPYHPERIAWGKSAGCSNKKITHEAAIKLLLDLEDSEAKEVQLNLLNNLSREVQLIKHRQLRPFWGMNITRFQDGKSMNEYQQNSIPCFYLNDLGLPPPIVEYAKEREREGIRGDKRVSEQPFLPSIRVYIQEERN